MRRDIINHKAEIEREASLSELTNEWCKNLIGNLSSNHSDAGDFAESFGADENNSSSLSERALDEELLSLSNALSEENNNTFDAPIEVGTQNSQRKINRKRKDVPS
ncbi:6141_t:CDS:2 [Acaulospora morrowiae]|uniref:6141_t:CDS:1 n=1 Tax=Acaulospora morrowiae TaxID=94023 RepID=A0A9N9B1V0_9GLOM|nr:6141_t:CDS:2 [Acaulospora morrowiae]